MNITGTLSTGASLTGTLAYGVLSGILTIPSSTSAETYTGSYEVTPSEEEQVLLTSEKFLTDNITVNPIPSNYGLITWNGATLTVS